MGSSDRDSTNLPSNLISLCEPCHREVESHRAAAVDAGYIVGQHEDPQLVPVLYRGTLTLLDNKGTKRVA